MDTALFTQPDAPRRRKAPTGGWFWRFHLHNLYSFDTIVYVERKGGEHEMDGHRKRHQLGDKQHHRAGRAGHLAQKAA